MPEFRITFDDVEKKLQLQAILGEAGFKVLDGKGDFFKYLILLWWFNTNFQPFIALKINFLTILSLTESNFFVSISDFKNIDDALRIISDA